MKGYTDLEQSKALAKILPLESADMTYCAITEGMREKMTIKNWEVNVGLDIAIKENLFSYRNGYVVPCWSLTALLSVLPKSTDIVKEEADTENEHYMCTVGIKDDITSTFSDNPVDACVAMIEKLNELKIL